MNISDKAKKHIDACRFCWMCRHVCPVGNATSQERNTSRARALGLSRVYRGTESLSMSVDNLYECALCGACVNDCMTGWDPVFFTIECKTDACMSGFIPEYVEKMLENFEISGNIYGKEINPQISFKENKTDTLIFFGEDARYKAQSAIGDVTTLLENTGAKYTTLNNEVNSGNSLYFLTGKSAETFEQMKKCAKSLNAFKKVIVYDPADLKLFIREYKEFGIVLTVEIISFNEYLLQLFNGGKLKLKKSTNTYTLQDNFNYSRELDNAENARILLEKCGNLKDMYLNRKQTVFAGSLVMNEYIPETVKKMAQKRWENAISAESKILVTESPCEYVMLKSVKPDNIELKSFEQVIIDNIE